VVRPAVRGRPKPRLLAVVGYLSAEKRRRAAFPEQMAKPEPRDYRQIDSANRPALLVVVDAEEQFDWSRPYSRTATNVQHMRFIGRVQDIFDQYKVTPVYVVDYPVASQPEGYKPLREIHADARCLIGSHVHPWVTPPFEEHLDRRNSFPGNLPPTLEAAKLKMATDRIEENFGLRPTIHKAGRYGIGPNTPEILENQGYEIDVSICPHMDFSEEGGPDFTHFTARPYWFGKKRRLLELPVTMGFEGKLRNFGVSLHPNLTRKIFRAAHIPGLFSHLGLLNKVSLSPEGNTISEQIKLVRSLYSDGLRVFSLTFHSPSVEPGNTPYVNSQNDLATFLSRLRQIFDYFMGKMDGIPTTPQDMRKTLSATLPTQ
jgi:hypothetical protein